jgi:glycosyltransferase involved in cell wall biosynthesis
MADLQAAVIAPFVRLVRKKHFLWYAHSHKSVYLSWASIWINGVISSTGGSCPIHNGKVALIGQSVNPKMFPARDSTKLDKNLLVHVGRLDRSKNIDLLIQATIAIQELNSGAKLTLIGSSANVESSDYLAELTTCYGPEIDAGTVSFTPSIPREKLSAALREFDIFIHAYKGSLDKTLIEATFSFMPVITINPEYITIFGTWSNLPSPTLYQEYLALDAMGASEIINQLHRRLNIAISSHSSDQWIQKLSEILAPGVD